MLPLRRDSIGCLIGTIAVWIFIAYVLAYYYHNR